MTQSTHPQTSKLVLLLYIIGLSFGISAQGVYDFTNALALNSENNTEVSADKPAVSDLTAFTSIHDISITNYFQLVGKKIMPYMIVENTTNNFSPALLSANNVSLVFTTNEIQFTENGQTKTFKVENVEQYVNTSDKCLIRTKIEIQCEPSKVGKKKVEHMIEVYLDQNDHISFIAVGDTELYLRP
ncbi:MAG: hypothetical protein H7X71_03185 [Chitinophagales bacterium]|nr:hypothetical protein [Chitinophagales bacterium]